MAYKTINIGVFSERLDGIFDRARADAFGSQEELLAFVEGEMQAYADRITCSDAYYERGDAHSLSREEDPLPGSYGIWYCPRCKARVSEEADFEKCGCCGQCLSWEELLPFR